jgi:hypothetical protein
MEKLLSLLLIRIFVHNIDDAIKIYNVIFPEQKTVVSDKKSVITGTTTKPIVEIKKPSTKKDELIESLSYLKNKSSKTKQDKDSIGVLEAVLKNME